MQTAKKIPVVQSLNVGHNTTYFASFQNSLGRGSGSSLTEIRSSGRGVNSHKFSTQWNHVKFGVREG